MIDPGTTGASTPIYAIADDVVYSARIFDGSSPLGEGPGVDLTVYAPGYEPILAAYLSFDAARQLIATLTAAILTKDEVVE